MFKKLLVSMVLGISLLAAFSLGAQGSKPTVLVKLEVNNQLSLSEYQAGQSKFIHQVGQSDKESAKGWGLVKTTLPIVSIFWTMAFALLCFVVRLTVGRI